MDDELGAQVTI